MRMFCTCLMLCAATLLLGQGSTAGNKSPEFMVPVKVEQKFAIEHPDIKAQWRKEGQYFKAMFINPRNNMGYITVYDQEANIVRKEKELEPQEYPQVINDYHEKKFPGEGFVVWSVVDSAGNISYYSPRTEETLYFDQKGKRLNDDKKSLADSLLSPAR